MSEKRSLFEVDKEGLAKILARKGAEFAVTELIQNAWDEDVSQVTVSLTPVEGKRARYVLEVTDDSPEGFRDLAHAYTLFADSYKKDDPGKRGRFNLGEKLVIAICDEAAVISTKGTIKFAADGREHTDEKTEAGTIFRATIRMTKKEAEATAALVRTLIPPPGIETTFNGEPLLRREKLREFKTGESIPTEVADEEGLLRRVRRYTTVALYQPLPGEKASLYEMGIPVVETGDTWHVDVGQKVPLNTDRDNVPPPYLREIRKEVLNNAHDILSEDASQEKWVDNALEDDAIKPEAVNRALDQRFGTKRVITDPSDREGTKLAASMGYTVIPTRGLSKGAWENVRQFEAAKPAGQVTPSPKVLAGEKGAAPPKKITEGMEIIKEYAEGLGQRLLGGVTVKFVSDTHAPFSAWFGGRELTFNVGRLGYAYFDQGPTDEVNRLIIHEFGHHYASDHLSSAYHDALCRLGARLARLALEEPEFFEMYAPGPEVEATAEFA